MTGTSLDGIDLAWVREIEHGGPIEVIAAASVPLEPTVQSRFRGVILGDAMTAESLSTLEADYSQGLVDAIATFQAEHPGLAPRVLGCHGQTLFHHPARQTSWQMLNPYPLARQAGCPVAFDFRRNDMAWGGQGAPLAPLFHAAHFARAGESVAVVNLGGIANVSVLLPGQPPRGFDTGPANTLLDAWTWDTWGRPFDTDGRYAQEGQILDDLLHALRAEPFFKQSPPKSTGREHFHLAWLHQHAPRPLHEARPEDVLRTLVELTALTVTDVLPDDLDLLYLCGGGAFNPVLVAAINARTDALVTRTEDAGIGAEHVESACFGWLALQCLDQRALATSHVTGSEAACVLGVLTPHTTS